MLVFATLISLLGLSFAGRASYLGGDIEEYAEISKKSHMYPKSNRPVTAKQLEDYKKYQSKFSDIAKAYSEGYKAAIQAVQARAVIAQKRLHGYKKSSIPAAPRDLPGKMAAEDAGAFKNAVPNLVTVPGTEKSSIPRPDDLLSVAKRSPWDSDEKPKETGFHKGIPSILLSEQKRSEISRLNAAAMHRNVYFDGMGGNSYGGVGGVLSRQSWKFTKKHRRSVDDNGDEEYVPQHIIRHRRSHMPYLGQNLDRIGVVRVRPNWDTKAKKETVPKPEVVAVKGTTSPLLASSNPFARSEVPQNKNVNQQNPSVTAINNAWNPWQQRSQIPVTSYNYASSAQGVPAYQNPYPAYAFPSMTFNNLHTTGENVRTRRSLESSDGGY